MSAIEEAYRAVDAGELAGARAIAEQCTRETPDDPNAWKCLAETCLASGAVDEAIPMLHRAIELDPKDFQLLYGLGLSHHHRFEFDLAAVYYRRAIALGVPNLLEACENIVIGIAASGDKQGAIWFAKEIGKIHTPFRDPLLRWAHSIGAPGDRPKGMTLWALTPLHGALSDHRRKQVEATRALIRQGGKKGGILGFLRGG